MSPASDLFDWENADYYTLLGIGPLADLGEIRKAYRTMAKLHHPDRYPLDSPERLAAADRFKALTQAQETLTDAALRSAYDAQLEFAQLWRYNPMQYQINIPPRPEEPPRPRPPVEDDDDDADVDWEAPGSFDEELERAATDPAPARPRGISDAAKRSAANAYYTQGLRYYGYGHYDQAMRSFQLAMQLDPTKKVSPHIWAKLVRYAYGFD